MNIGKDTYDTLATAAQSIDPDEFPATYALLDGLKKSIDAWGIDDGVDPNLLALRVVSVIGLLETRINSLAAQIQRHADGC